MHRDVWGSTRIASYPFLKELFFFFKTSQLLFYTTVSTFFFFSKKKKKKVSIFNVFSFTCATRTESSSLCNDSRKCMIYITRGGVAVLVKIFKRFIVNHQMLMNVWPLPELSSQDTKGQGPRTITLSQFMFGWYNTSPVLTVAHQKHHIHMLKVLIYPQRPWRRPLPHDL